MKKVVTTIATLAILATPLLTTMANARSFSDVSSGAWYAQTVNEMTSSGVGFGTDSNHYAPNQAITRGEVAQMIYNALGKPAVSGDSGFSDVAGSPHATAITYCKQAGIIAGYPDGTFGTNKTITRQEASRMLWNLFTSNKFSSPLHTMSVPDKSQFTDNSTFQSWGVEGIVELSLNGVIKGYPDGSFKPDGKITRAEMTQMMDGALHKVGFQFTQQASASTLTTNSDGSQSPANVTIPSNYTAASYQTASEDEIKNLITQVKFKTDGQNVTVTLPDTGDSNVEWDVFAYTNNFTSSTDDYVSGNGTSITYKNADAVIVRLRQPNNVGSGAYLGATYKYSNGQWTLQYR